MFLLQLLRGDNVIVQMDMTSIQNSMNYAHYDKMFDRFCILSTDEVSQTVLKGKRNGVGVVNWHEKYYAPNAPEILKDNRKMVDLCADEEIFLV